MKIGASGDRRDVLRCRHPPSERDRRDIYNPCDSWSPRGDDPGKDLSAADRLVPVS